MTHRRVQHKIYRNIDAIISKAIVAIVSPWEIEDAEDLDSSYITYKQHVRLVRMRF